MWLNLEHPHQFFKFFLFILHKKFIFSILPYHFYKTPTSVYLFYKIFQNIHSSQFFYYFSQLPFTYIRSLSLSLSLSLSKTTNPDHFFTGQSRSFLHRSIHKPSSTSTDLSLCWFVCAGLFLCVCVSVLIFQCGCVCVWVCLCASEEKKMRSWGHCVQRRERKIGANEN